MSEWRELPIGELMAEFHDGPHATPKPSADGPAFLGIKNLTNAGNLDLSAVRHIAPEDFARWTKRVTPQQDDIVFTYEATLHRYALIPHGFRGCLGRRLALIRPNLDRADPRYLHQALRSPGWRSTVEERVIAGATVDRIPLIDFPSFPICVPGVETQRRIAAVLSAFDELILINERRVELLEYLARSLYREWFVRRCLPGAEDAGWASTLLFDVADVGFGFSFKSPAFGPEGVHAVVRIRDVPRGTTATFTNEAAPERYAVRDGDVLIGMDGNFHLNRWSGGDAWLNQRVTRLRPRAELAALHLLLAVESPIAQLNQTITGTTVAHLGKRHLEQISVPLPESGRISQATAAFEAIGDAIVVLRKQVRACARTRDLLLPRLVTGRLDISDIDLDDLLSTELAG